MRPAEDIKKLIRKMNDQASAEMDQKVLKNAMQALAQSQETISTRRESWRIIMRNPIIKFAAAAVVIIAVLSGIGQLFGSSVTFAQVIEPILNARTVVLDFTSGENQNSPVIHDVIIGNRIRRTMSNIPVVMVIDVDNARMLALDPNKKTAFYADIQGAVQQGTRNILGIVRNIVSDIEDEPERSEKLGSRILNGKKVTGFLIRGHNEEVTVWADSDTARPVQIELTLGGLTTKIMNIEFDVPLDESLVSMEPPADYTFSDMEYNMTDFSEQDFVESLRIWAEVILDGQFPASISPDEYLKAVPVLVQRLGQSNTTKERATQSGMAFSRGLMFFQVTAVESCDWQYAGNGVKFGEADKAIFWYQPKNSKTYRVIYGDLSIEDVLPEDLPE